MNEKEKIIEDYLRKNMDGTIRVWIDDEEIKVERIEYYMTDDLKITRMKIFTIKGENESQKKEYKEPNFRRMGKDGSMRYCY